MAPNYSSVYRLTLGLMLCAAPSIAQNLITNPAFDDALNGWTTTGSFWSVVVDDVELFPPLFADGFDDGTAEAWTRIETGT